MDLDKIKVVMERPISKTLNNLREFLGLTCYYYNFIRNYGQIETSLTMLLENEVFLGFKKQLNLHKNLRRLCVRLISSLHLTS